MTRDLISGAKWLGKGNIPDKYIIDITEPNNVFYTDLLLTALISLMGWFSFAAILAVLLFFIIKGFMLCFKQRSSLGFFVSFSIMMTFGTQVIGYIVYNLGFQFSGPISLPLISYGNTATVINLVLIGLMLSVFRTGNAVSDSITPIGQKELTI